VREDIKATAGGIKPGLLSPSCRYGSLPAAPGIGKLHLILGIRRFLIAVYRPQRSGAESSKTRKLPASAFGK